MIREAIDALVAGQSLSIDQAAQTMDEIMDGEATPAQFGAFVTALRLKGETPEEIAGMARVMREKSLHVQVEGSLVDTAGTGADGLQQLQHIHHRRLCGRGRWRHGRQARQSRHVRVLRQRRCPGGPGHEDRAESRWGTTLPGGGGVRLHVRTKRIIRPCVSPRAPAGRSVSVRCSTYWGL